MALKSRFLRVTFSPKRLFTGKQSLYCPIKNHQQAPFLEGSRMNSQLSAKERREILSSMKRVFSRSDARKRAIDRSKIKHFDPHRPRVKNWGQCQLCGDARTLSDLVVDHIYPIIPPHRCLSDYTWEEVVDSIWCSEDNLRAVCKECHHRKNKRELAQRLIERSLRRGAT